MDDSQNISERIKDAWMKDRDPNSLAKGLGVGLFVAFLPLPAFQAVIAFGIAYFLGVNRILAVAGTFATNWFTMPPIFAGAVWVGSHVLPGVTLQSIVPVSFSFRDLSSVSQDLLMAYATGTTLFSFIAGLFGYLGMKIYANRRESQLLIKINRD